MAVDRIMARAELLRRRHTRYARFLSVGATVGAICVGLREVIDLMLGNDLPANYAVSVFVVYVVGIGMSYLLQARFVFGDRPAPKSFWRKLSFVAVAGVSAGMASALSTVIRFGANMDALAGRFAPALSFIIAVLCVSFVNFQFGKRVVFVKPAGHDKP